MTDAIEVVVKKSIAVALRVKGELGWDGLFKLVRKTTGHGTTRVRKFLSQMVGAGEVEELPRKPPRKRKITYVLTKKGRHWLRR